MKTNDYNTTSLAEDNSFLDKQLDKFFDNTILDLNTYPVRDVSNVIKNTCKYALMDLSNLENKLQQQIKAFLRHKLHRLNKKYLILLQNLLRPLCFAIPYMETCAKNSILDYSEDELNANYKIFLNENYNLKIKDMDYRILPNLYSYTLIQQERLIPTLWERNIWEVNEMHLSTERLSLCSENTDMNFYKVSNAHNRELLKKYMKYLLTLTNQTYSYIYHIFIHSVEFLEFISDTKLENCTRADMELYISFIMHTTNTNQGFNTKIQYIAAFLNYLCKLEIITEVHLSKHDKKKRVPYEYKDTAPDDFVLYQLFNYLQNLETPYQLMYLIQLWTGLRVSDICGIPLNCVREDSDCCKLYTSIHKMQNDDYIMVPEILYKRIKDYQKIVLTTLPNAVYLFYSAKVKDINRPVTAKTYTKHVNAFLSSHCIVNPDGSQYTFKSHSYRHKRAKDLTESGTPLYMISQVLSHKSINMTLAYAEVRQAYRKKLFTEYIVASGDADPLQTQEDINIEWLRDNLDKQALANGFCCLPCKITCPHMNACLHCPNFITTKEYLPVHKQQLKFLETELKEYEHHGYLANAATAKKDIKALKEIIARLERS